MSAYTVSLSIPVESEDLNTPEDAVKAFRADVIEGIEYVYSVTDDMTGEGYDVDAEGWKVTAHGARISFDAAMAELDAAYTDLRSETYPYPSQYQRVEDAKSALRAAAGIA